MTTPQTPGLDIPGLETVYDQLAQAIDSAGAEKSQLFLVKLALMNANALADPALTQQHIQAALRDL
jgi:sulfur relay (sulfurtransferase) complex TusBCD TusD component (DsrE family)